jgi:hypothetical protein
MIRALRTVLMASLLVSAASATTGCKKEGVFFQSINPASGRPSGGEEVRIRGHGFRALGGLEVRIGPKAAQNVGIADDETIVLTTPEAREADRGHPIDVYILTNEGRSIVLRGAFTYRRATEGGGANELQRRL